MRKEVELVDKIRDVQLKNQIEHIHRSSNSIEHHLRNSIEIELLMQLEHDGLGHWTITQLLNKLQDLNTNGETESFYVLANRRKRKMNNEGDHYKKILFSTHSITTVTTITYWVR